MSARPRFIVGGPTIDLDDELEVARAEKLYAAVVAEEERFEASTEVVAHPCLLAVPHSCTRTTPRRRGTRTETSDEDGEGDARTQSRERSPGPITGPSTSGGGQDESQRGTTCSALLGASCEDAAQSHGYEQATSDILTVEEFAARMRWNRKTAYERARRGELPGLLPGKPYRIHWPSVLASASTGQGRDQQKRGRK